MTSHCHSVVGGDIALPLGCGGDIALPLGCGGRHRIATRGCGGDIALPLGCGGDIALPLGVVGATSHCHSVVSQNHSKLLLRFPVYSSFSRVSVCTENPSSRSGLFH